MTNASYEVKCLMCGVHAGPLLLSKAVAGAGRVSPLPGGERRRCLHSGGSLYIERILDDAGFDRAICAGKLSTGTSRPAGEQVP